MNSGDEIRAGSYRLMTMEEVARSYAERQEFQATLSPNDPRHDKMYRLDLELGYLDIFWGGYEYNWELKRLDTPHKLAGFLDHVLAKDWEYATGRRVGRLVRTLSDHFRWGIHGAEPKRIVAPEVRTTSDAEERGKLTPKLRYDVLLRDDFRCRACGFSVASGAHLHIDHIHPISKGGLTVFENLQALCSVCNQGKGARR
jgi:5-methylcytosine-specific restriction endonuclease McrA